MKNLSAFLLACSMLLTSCASLKIPNADVYPFRAVFEGRASVQGEDISFKGALAIVSRDHGYAQIYGPMGLAAFTLDISQGQVKIYDVWGKQIKQYTLPAEQFLGLIAGVPPESPYLWKRTRNDTTSVTYTWGNLHVDEDLLPQELHIRGNLPADAIFTRKDGTIGLMMTYGSDKVQLSISVVSGGRWGKGSFNGDKGGLY